MDPEVKRPVRRVAMRRATASPIRAFRPKKKTAGQIYYDEFSARWSEGNSSADNDSATRGSSVSYGPWKSWQVLQVIV